MTGTDWADIARNLAMRRNIRIQRGEDYATAEANALQDQFRTWAADISRVEDYARWSQVDASEAAAAKRAATDAQDEAARLRALIDANSEARITGVAETLASVPASKTGTHHDTCWQKHPGCLAARIRRQIEGEEA